MKLVLAMGVALLVPVLAMGFAASGGRTLIAIGGALIALAMLRRKRRLR